ncbi:U3 small nucleolar RNA-associated protein 14 homolog A [Cheilinus undulatus]|uniref:U3 small nucleolar RNA-associated protein 14 homolog A n=1 Tax=Cheilinus undulatus TaxID=241271 RepID=UPI001BD65251|nr:U3 small nucleolar RNA-associated protein 14 homolog A [Cheilinus undulatus]
MTKVTLKKKMSRKKAKRAEETEDSREKKTEVVYDDEDDEEDLNENITSEEEEDEDGEDERKRLKLLEAISSLGGKRKKTLGERSEATVQMSEFSVNADGEGEKVDLSDLIGSLEKTPAVPSKTKKQLKTLQQNKKTIESPLSKQETERIQRDLSFQKAASEVSRWKPIIKQNQRAEQLVFPLNQEPPGPKPMERVVTGWKARTPLEEEIFALLNVNKQPINDPVLTKEEEVSMKAMSLEEAKIRRAELQKVRALQSYYEAKARRERKIKSKKYHKVQNKAKRKDFLKKFDEMVKSDPATALEELNKMELARMQERMSLKHQNSGKWAKSKAIMAKYDEGARKAMQQQLEVNKELTQKLVTRLNDEEDEEEEGGDPEVLPDFVNDAEQGGDSSNPWMRGKLSEDPVEKEVTETVDLTAEEEPEEEQEEEEVKETEEETLLREFENKRKQRQAQEDETILVINLDDDDEEEEAEGEEQLSEFTNLYKEITDSQQEAEAERAEAAADALKESSSAQLEETLQRIRTLEDTEELLAQRETTTDEVPIQPTVEENLPSEAKTAGRNKKRKRGIELKEVLTKEAKAIQIPLTQTVVDGEDSDDDQRGLIREAFAGDDVVSDFLNDKKRQEEAGKPKMVDLTLPGWGDWGGIGLNPSRKKRRRFRVKTAPPPLRKDQHLPNVIISEKRNSSITPHLVNSLPFPFETHAQFESTIRAPLGRTWNTEQTVKKISKPKVVTQLGAIIEPMAKEELMKNKKQTSTSTGTKNKVTVDSGKGKSKEKGAKKS